MGGSNSLFSEGTLSGSVVTENIYIFSKSKERKKFKRRWQNTKEKIKSGGQSKKKVWKRRPKYIKRKSLKKED